MLVKNLLTLLEKYQIKPNKTLGQNFLIDKNILDKIIETANLKKDDIVLEVGPGIGVLTQELAKKASKVIAVEKDAKMVEILQNVLSVQNVQNVQVVHTDILKLDPSTYTLAPNYKIVANIPYYLTSHLIRILLENKNPPQEIVLLIQKEVAQRIVAKPPHMNLLAVSVQFYATPEIISYVSRNCFLPAPKVDSAIIKIKGLGYREQGLEFFKVVKAGFSHPRKQLAGNLSTGLKINRKEIEKILLQNNIKPTQRAETLSVEQWEVLTKSYSQLF